MSEKKRQCFVILATQRDEYGYIPSLVTENEPGHSPMTGGPDQEPWRWGKTLDKAESVCAKVNLDRYGLTEHAADNIVCSSMFHRTHGSFTDSQPDWDRGVSTGDFARGEL